VVHFRDAARSRTCAGQPPPTKAGTFLFLPICNGGFISIEDAASFSAGTLLGPGRLITIIYCALNQS
jgi:hypothetical protein